MTNINSIKYFSKQSNKIVCMAQIMDCKSGKVNKQYNDAWILQK